MVGGSLGKQKKLQSIANPCTTELINLLCFITILLCIFLAQLTGFKCEVLGYDFYIVLHSTFYKNLG
jgi:hypothetical protein